MSKLLCRSARTTLAARVLDTGDVPPWLSGHVGACLRCQAVVAQTLRLRRTLTEISPVQPGVDETGHSPRVIAAAVASAAALAVVAARLRAQRT